MSADDGSQQSRLEQVLADYMQRVDSGEPVNREELLRQHPDLADELREYFEAADQVEHMAGPTAPETTPLNAAAGPAASPLGVVRYFGDYELLEEIGRGGMGVVYKARQVSLNRIVALKMILAGQLASEADVQRFHTEAEAAANLDHPGIVPIHEVGVHQGQHYFSMGYVEGQSLAEMVREHPLPAKQSAAYLKAIAEAIHYAHQKGILHRDLKPSNVLIDRAGHPRITDFGLAKRVADDRGLTVSGQLLGTPSYMSPEQAAGKSRETGPRSDVYSLGALLYELLTGRPPFRAETPLETLRQVLDAEPAPPRLLNPTAPRDLETICLKCLEKDPRRRYASAQELGDELQRFLDGRPIQARPISAADRAWRWCRRNPGVAALTAALALALVIGTVISTGFAVRAHEEAKRSAASAFREQKEAERSAHLAVKANDLAAQAKKEADRATSQERLTQRYLYSAHMNLANQAWNSGNVPRVVELLEQHRPPLTPPSSLGGEARVRAEDLRSFDWRYLWRLCNRQRKTIPLCRHEQVAGWDSVFTKASPFLISPNGQFLAVGTYEGGTTGRFDEVRLWDVTAGTLRKTIVVKTFDEGAKAWVTSSSVTIIPKTEPDSDSRWKTCQVFQGLFFSADGRLFATTTWDHVWDKDGYWEPRAPRLTLWDTQTMQLRTTIPLPNFRAERTSVGTRKVKVGEKWEVQEFPPEYVKDKENIRRQAIAISPNNKMVALGYISSYPEGKHLGIKLWAIPEGAGVPVGQEKLFRRRELSRDEWLLSFLQVFGFTPDGESLAWKTKADRELTLTSVSGAGKDTSSPLPHVGVLSPDGKYCASWSGFGSLDGRGGEVVKLFDAKTGKEVHTFPVAAMHPDCRGSETPLRFSPDSRILAVARGSSLELWDVESKEKIGDVRGHTGSIRAIGFGADSKTIISVAPGKGGGPYQAKVWDVNTRPGPDEFSLGKGPRQQTPGEPDKERHRIEALGISPDGKTLATVWSGDPIVGWPELPSAGMQVAGRLSAPVPVGALGPHAVVLYSLSPESLGKPSGELLRWDNPKQFLPMRVAFVRGGKWLAISGQGFNQEEGVGEIHIQLWGISQEATGTKAELHRTLVVPCYPYVVHRDYGLPVFSGDATKLACPQSGTTYDKKTPNKTHTDGIAYVKLLDLPTGKLRQLPADKESWFPYSEGVLWRDWAGLCHAVLSSVGNRLFTGQSPRFFESFTRIVAWDWGSGEALSVLESPLSLEGMPQALALSPDDNTLATCHEDHSIHLWDVSEPKLREVMGEVKQLAEDVRSGKRKGPTEPAPRPRAILRGHVDAITAIAFHPDGKILASAGKDHTIKLWDVVTGEVRLTLEGHEADILAIAFTADGNTLVSGDVGGKVKLWRAGTGNDESAAAK